ncbi:MAG: nucleotide sugar dehydrogenase [Ilumatobacteraceae bacterium]
MPTALDVVVVGGCGHVGLPLSLAFARAGQTVAAYDTNPTACSLVNAGEMPFLEPEAPEVLAKVLADGTFIATTDASVVARARTVIVVVGTPVDEHLNPDPNAVTDAVSELAEHLLDGQLLVLRSTIYPGLTRLIDQLLRNSGKKIDVAFCPERIAEGKAFTELYELPQVVSGCSDSAVARATELFSALTESIVVVTPEEAELVKLFTNTWRYIKFAAANQFYTIANDFNLDFERIRHAIRFDYPRAADMPAAGFAAGPCLFKDTMQLAAFNNNNFTLGHASMMVNEGLPLYVVSRIERKFDLSSMTVGILGMAFKAESDDPRSSLSYKLRRILRFKAKEVLCTDPYVKSPDLSPIEELIERCDLLIVGTPHATYKDLQSSCPVVDIWNVLGRGVTI